MASTAEDPMYEPVICHTNKFSKIGPTLYHNCQNLLNYSKDKVVKMKKHDIPFLKKNKKKKTEAFDMSQRRKTADELILRNTYEAFLKSSQEKTKGNIYTSRPTSRMELNKESIETDKDDNYEVLEVKSNMVKSEELKSSPKSPLSLAEFITSSCTKRIPPKLPKKTPGIQKHQTDSNLIVKVTKESRKLSLPIIYSSIEPLNFDQVTAQVSGIEKIKLTGNDPKHSASATSTNILNLETLPSDLNWSILTVEDIADFLSLLHVNSDVIKTFINFNIDGKRLNHMSKEMLSMEPFCLNEFFVEQIYLFMNGWRPKYSSVCSRWNQKN